MFITFEGIDGSGKTTQIELLKKYFQRNNQDCLVLREPGGTNVSEKIRDILLDKSLEISDTSELLLFQAARADLVEKLIKPAIQKDIIVISDRFFDSTTAYQGYGRKIPMEIINKSNQIGSLGVSPDITFYLKIDKSISDNRNEQKVKDRMEISNSEFYNNVIEGFNELSKLKRFKTIDGSQTIDEIHKNIIKEIENKLIFKEG